MTVTPPSATPLPPAGWYPEGTNGQRYWDGAAWTEHRAPLAQAPQQAAPVMTSGQLRNTREIVYNRPQTGHSLTLWILLSVFLFFPVIGLIYYSASPNHYWHA